MYTKSIITIALISNTCKLVLSKDPVLRYQVGTKKMKTSRYHVFPSTGGTEYLVKLVLDAYSLYDFRDAENVDGISESSYKN